MIYIDEGDYDVKSPLYWMKTHFCVATAPTGALFLLAASLFLFQYYLALCLPKKTEIQER